MKIILDMMGGDRPEENRKALEQLKEEASLETGGKLDDAEIIPAFGETAEESMEKAFALLSESDNSALVSMGETRNLVIGAMNHIGVEDGIQRPVFCPVLPTFTGGIVGICDSGAIINTNPEMLVQYALLGSEYIKKTYGIESPRVGLLNIGTEPDKGDSLHREAYRLLSLCEGINFRGNMEARDFLSGDYDLAVSDGFSGNIMLKSIEGVAEGLIRRLYRYIPSDEINFMNYHNYGGSALLGAKKLIIKAHGSSDSRAIQVAIRQAAGYLSNL